MLKYSLYPLKIADENDAYYAKPQNVMVFKEEDLFKLLVKPGGVTETQLVAVLSARNNLIQQLLEEGHTVQDKFVRYSIQIKGKFNGVTDQFDRRRHKIVPHVSLARNNNFEFDKLRTHKVALKNKSPHISQVFDFKTKSKNQMISCDGVVRIRGHHLRFDPKDNNQGIWITDDKRNSVKVELVIENTPSEILFYSPINLPDLPLRILIVGQNGEREHTHNGMSQFYLEKAP
ncbi:MAG: DNA-binding domain-containing protein [Bacteroidales bacterium]